MLTLDDLNKKLADLDKDYEQLVANIHALEGARMVIKQLIAQLTATE